MALDPAISDQLTTMILTNAKLSSQRINAIGENLMQGLGVVQNTTVQAQASTTDDAATMAALSTASRIPQSGALPASS